jgi:hypothetical protein
MYAGKRVHLGVAFTGRTRDTHPFGKVPVRFLVGAMWLAETSIHDNPKWILILVYEAAVSFADNMQACVLHRLGPCCSRRLHEESLALLADPPSSF